MVVPSKQSSKVDQQQVGKAVKALFKHSNGKQDSSLFNDDCVFSLIVGLKNLPKDKKVLRIEIPNTLNGTNKEICLLVKDPQEKYEAVIENNNIDGVKKVIGCTKLKNKYKQYEAKRNLSNSYDIFMADCRIIHLCPRLLGKAFYEKKRQPVPINMDAKDLNKEITKARDATYMFFGKGVCVNVKIGHTGMTQQQVVDNIVMALETIGDSVEGKWKNIQSIHLKTIESISLPIYNSNPKEALMTVAKKSATATAATVEA